MDKNKAEPFKVLGSVKMFVFEISLCPPRLCLFVKKYSKNCNTVKILIQFKITVLHFNLF